MLQPSGNLQERSQRRESVLFMCDLGRRDGSFAAQARVRNVSPVGMMAETEGQFAVGEVIIVAFRTADPVYGTVNWVKRGQIGVAFHSEVDPKLLRRPLVRAVERAPLENRSFEPGPGA